jgi:hypothetical protein
MSVTSTPVGGAGFRFGLLLVHTIDLKTRRRMHLCMQDDQNGQKTRVLTSAEETRLTCFILLQNIFSVVNNLV